MEYSIQDKIHKCAVFYKICKNYFPQKYVRIQFCNNCKCPKAIESKECVLMLPCVYVYVAACKHVCIPIISCVCVCAYMRILIFSSVCLHICTCMCVHVYACL